jgi:hypothetical protein
VNRRGSFGSLGMDLELHRFVPAFQAWTTEDNTLPQLPDPKPFEFVLPANGQTYISKQIKIEWLVRVRVRFGSSDQDCVKDAKFVLLPARQVS